MKKYIKILLSFLFCLLLFTNTASANEIGKYIAQSDFEHKSTVSVYVVDADNNKVLYRKNEEKLLNPASVLKVLTFGASYMMLENGYKFETSLLKDSSNNLYVKLGGDVLLTQNDLNNLFKEFKNKYPKFAINNIYIDDSIIDKTPYSTGWMEDDMWPNARAITPYIVDNNYTDILIKRSSLASKVDVIQNDDYKIPVVNELKIADKKTNVQRIKFERMYGEDSSIVNLKGEVVEDQIINLPVLKPEINFNIKLQNAIKKNELNFNKQITAKKAGNDAIKIATVSHSIEDISKKILLNSDNFAAEVVFRIAAAKYINYSHPATLDDACKMFYQAYGQLVDEGIKVVDGSGVSRYNIVNSQFVVNAMEYLFEKTNVKNLMATSQEGTLSERLLFLKDNIRAKTGTLSGMSSIAGILTTKKGTNAVFAIIVQNSPKRKAVLKNFENTVIGAIYKEY